MQRALTPFTPSGADVPVPNLPRPADTSPPKPLNPPNHLNPSRLRAPLAVSAVLLGALLVSFAQPAGAAVVAVADDPVLAANQPRPGWVGTWGTAPTGVPDSDDTGFEDQTLRQIVRTSIGGDQLRVRMSNEFGDAPLVLGEVRVAELDPQGEEGATLPGTDREVTFGGERGFTVPAGAPALSDPVDLPLAEGADLVVSAHLPEHTPGHTVNGAANQENYLADGNVTGDPVIEPVATQNRWYFLTGVEVSADTESTTSVVAFGDSLTTGSAVGTNQRWPDRVCERLRADP